MASPFDQQPRPEPLPIAERRHRDELAAQRRQTYFLIGMAVLLPVLAAAVLVVCLVLPLMREPRSAVPESNEPRPGSVEDFQARRERQRQEAEEREEEEMAAIRRRIDRAVEARQREAERREQGRPPRLSESGDEGDRTLNP